jgi:hypothetical protein
VDCLNGSGPVLKNTGISVGHMVPSFGTLNKNENPLSESINASLIKQAISIDKFKNNNGVNLF